MRINVERQGVTASVRPVPTDNTMAVLPLTLDRVGQDPTNIETEGTKVQNLKEAFATFKPKIDFKHTVDDHEFSAELSFGSLNDFSPEAIRTRKTGQRNDLADLQSRIDTLNQLKVKFAQARVKRAWEQPEHRAQILQAMSEFQAQVEKIATGAAGGEG
jgi:hypothetical protein